jgi:hypothetical protein
MAGREMLIADEPSGNGRARSGPGALVGYQPELAIDIDPPAKSIEP